MLPLASLYAALEVLTRIRAHYHKGNHNKYFNRCVYGYWEASEVSGIQNPWISTKLTICDSLITILWTHRVHKCLIHGEEILFRYLNKESTVYNTVDLSIILNIKTLHFLLV